MFDLRTLGIAVAAFGATFAIGWYFGLGKAATPAIANPEQRPVQQVALPMAAPAVATAPPARPIEIKPLWGGPKPAAKEVTPPPQGKGLTEDANMRQIVIWRSQAYQRPTCNADARTLYVNAATKYAEALMRMAGCHNFPKCPMGAGNLTDVWHQNRSAADIPVAEAMAAAHAAGGLSERSFRGDVGRAARVIAGVDFNAGPPPECESKSSRNSWRVRIRR